MGRESPGWGKSAESRHPVTPGAYPAPVGVRRTRVRLVGAWAVLAGAFSVWVVATDGQGHLGGAWLSDGPTIYGPLQVLLAVALAASALVVMVWRGPATPGAALAVAGLCAAVLAGTGVVSARRWPLYWGCCSDASITRPDLVRSLALMMAVACAVAAVACLAILVRSSADRPPVSLTAPAVLSGLAVAILGPLLVVEGRSTDTRDLIAWSLMYAGPLGTALVISGFLPRSTALVLAGSVLLCAAAAVMGDSFLETRQPWGAARPLVLACAAVVLLTRFVPSRDTQPRPQPH